MLQCDLNRCLALQHAEMNCASPILVSQVAASLFVRWGTVQASGQFTAEGKITGLQNPRGLLIMDSQETRKYTCMSHRFVLVQALGTPTLVSTTKRQGQCSVYRVSRRKQR